jgi:hypothetical protein
MRIPKRWVSRKTGLDPRVESAESAETLNPSPDPLTRVARFKRRGRPSLENPERIRKQTAQSRVQDQSQQERTIPSIRQGSRDSTNNQCRRGRYPKPMAIGKYLPNK